MSTNQYEQTAEKIDALPPDLKEGTLRFFGDWFGRPWDNIHQLLEARATGDGLTLLFSGGERLIVTKPRGLQIGRESFRIDDADIVRWEWHAYGRPQTPENFGSLTYVQKDGTIAVEDNVRWRGPTEHEVDPRAPAVELV